MTYLTHDWDVMWTNPILDMPKAQPSDRDSHPFIIAAAVKRRSWVWKTNNNKKAILYELYFFKLKLATSS